MAQPNEKSPYTVSSQEPFAPSSTEGGFVSVQPRPVATGKWFQIKKSLHKWWAVEAFSSFLALFIFALIITLLVLVDDMAYGDASKVSANAKNRPIIFAWLAFLSALMRASMLLPVATSIGQLKWSWFRSSRQLVDLEKFDSAAGSMFGSAKLLFALKFRSVFTSLEHTNTRLTPFKERCMRRGGADHIGTAYGRTHSKQCSHA